LHGWIFRTPFLSLPNQNDSKEPSLHLIVPWTSSVGLVYLALRKMNGTERNVRGPELGHSKNSGRSNDVLILLAVQAQLYRQIQELEMCRGGSPTSEAENAIQPLEAPKTSPAKSQGRSESQKGLLRCNRAHQWELEWAPSR
jgi:hypothetical protein